MRKRSAAAGGAAGVWLDATSLLVPTRRGARRAGAAGALDKCEIPVAGTRAAAEGSGGLILCTGNEHTASIKLLKAALLGRGVVRRGGRSGGRQRRGLIRAGNRIAR